MQLSTDISRLPDHRSSFSERAGALQNLAKVNSRPPADADQGFSRGRPRVQPARGSKHSTQGSRGEARRPRASQDNLQVLDGSHARTVRAEPARAACCGHCTAWPADQSLRIVCLWRWQGEHSCCQRAYSIPAEALSEARKRDSCSAIGRREHAFAASDHTCPDTFSLFAFPNLKFPKEALGFPRARTCRRGGPSGWLRRVPDEGSRLA